MAALPYLRVYCADWDADTSHLTTLQDGIYWRLVRNYWQRGGPLPADDKRLACIARVSMRDWHRNRHAIAEFFTDQENLWRHSRLDRELARVQAKSLNNQRPGNANAKGSRRVRDANETRTRIYTDTDKEKEIPNGISKKGGPKPLTHDWRPADFGKDTKSAKIIATWPDGRMETEIERFIAHHGSRANVMADWQQAWATWVLNSATFDKERVNGRGNHGQGDRTLRAAEAAFGPASEWSDDRPF